MITSDKYINAVTYTKAIGIMLMVFAHAIDNPPADNGYLILWKIIYTFHMPLFFIMSGYCFKETYLDNSLLFLWRKIKGIYIPFIAYTLVFIALHNLLCTLHIYESTDFLQPKDMLLRAVRAVTIMERKGAMLGTFWFLRELLFGNIFFFFTLKLCRRNKWITTAFLLVLTELFAVTKFCVPGFRITYLSFFAATFIAIGHIIRTTDFRLNTWRKIGIGLTLVATEVMLADQFRMDEQTPVSILFYILPAVAGTMLVYEFSTWLNRMKQSPILTFVGRHTLSVMALHFLSFKLVSLLIICCYGLPIESLTEFPILRDYAFHGWWLLYTFVGLTIPLLLTFFRTLCSKNQR